MNGKLLATVGGSIQLYKWVFFKDRRAFALQSECGDDSVILPLCVQSRGNNKTWSNKFSVFIIRRFKVKLRRFKRCSKKNKKPAAHWMATFELLKENSYGDFRRKLYNKFYLVGTTDFKLVLIQDIERASNLEVRSEYYTGEFISKFQHGYVAPPMVRSYAVNVPPTITFGTFNGVIAPLPREKFELLKRVEEEVTLATDNDVVGLSYEEWRQVNRHPGTRTRYFLDGDIMELFLGLEESKRNEIAGRVGVDVSADLYEQVLKLTTVLH
ncbi:DNA damage-binding protein 1a-like [Trifolium pratense]|uniref:DNA damage-binding protein 1a-like n=1 Tax=Trifolium pratense TaxID=57577 RepID=UPI001E6979D5|nr:DNA damage-binding protein 1a-like [Trifolium pratense]